MSNARLEVEIGASVKEFQRKLADSLKGLKALKDENKNLEKSFKSGKITSDKYYSALAKNNVNIQIATQRVSKYKKGITGVDNSMGGLKKSTANAVPAVTEFSRVIQDAPFGIQGVANNITQLTQNFGYLKKQTGSTSSAFKAMLSTLSGPAGVLLAVSAVTSLMVSYGDKLQFATDKNKEFTDSLEGIGTSSIVEFKTLTDTILDTTSSQKEQKRALELLKEKYSDFDSSLLTTKGNYNSAKTAVDNYTSSLIQQAKAKAGLTLIEEKFAKIIQIEEKKSLKLRNSFGSATVEQFEKRRKSLLKASKIQHENSLEHYKKEGKLNDELLKNLKTSYNKRIAQINKRFDSVKSIGNKEVNELKSQIARISKLTNVKDLILFGGGNKPKKTKPTKNVFVQERQIKYKEEDILETTDYNETTNDIIGSINWDEYYKLKEFDNQRNLLAERMLNLSQTADTLINQSISNSFNSLANNIANSLGQSAGFFGVFAGEIIKLGSKMLIAQLTQDKAKMVSNLAVAKTNAVRSATETAAKTPFGAFLLPALITAGVTAVSSAFGNIGTNAGSSSAGSSSRDFSSGFSGGYVEKNNNTVTFLIKGQDLFGVLDNFTRRNGNLGVNLQGI